jgi:hypothetical protein
MNDLISQAFIPFLSGSGGAALLVYILRKKLDNIDEIPGIKKDVEFIKEKIIENKLEFGKMEKHREEQILLKSEIKAQWRHIDELKEKVGV